MQAEATTTIETPIAQPNAVNYEQERSKVYRYEKNNGKYIIVKRSWKNIGVKQAKVKELSDYFENNADIDRSKSIQTLFKEYNNNHDLKISYSMFYKKYVEHFGPRHA